MRVPVRRQPETRIGERQLSYARPVAPVNLSPFNNLIEGVRDHLLDGQEARQRIDLNRRLVAEVNELQADFTARQRNPEISPIDFANSTNTTYTERHAALLTELRRGQYSQDLLDDFETRLGTVRQGFYERGLVHQVTQLRARAEEEVEDLALNASQYAAADPMHNYATARDMVRDAVRSHPDLTEAERAELVDQNLAVVRDAGARALAIQNPQLIIDTFDPQGLTAPYPTTPAATGTPAPTVEVPPSENTGQRYVNGWSPRRRNGGDNTDAQVDTYISVLAQGMGISPDTRITEANLPQMASIMARVESGGAPTARSVRNNNPGNIENGRFARSQPGYVGSDGRFAKFDTPQAGQNAQVALLRRYLNRGQVTIRSIIEGVPARSTNAASVAVRTSNEALAFRPDPVALAAATGTPIETGETTARPAPTQVASAPRFIDQPESQPGASVPSPPAGLRVPGNIDLTSRTPVTNADGTVSTIRSISISTEQGEVLIPTVVGGRVVSDEEAIAHYRTTGEHLGIFENEQAATAYAQQLHNQEAHRTGNLESIRTGNPLLDDLNGSERLQLLSRAREQLNRVTATQRAEMDVRIGNITAEALNNGGEIAAPIPTEQEVLRVYGPVEGPQRWAQITQSQATGRAITTFRTQSAETIQRALDDLEPEAGSPTYQTQLQIYQAAERAAQALLAERERDPAAYAMRYFPQVRQAAQQGTAQYYAALDRVYQTLGIDTRTAPVMTSEATQQLTRNYRTMTPQQRGQFIEQNMEEMGEVRFRRFVSGMEGTTAATDARIYALLRHYPNAAVTRNLYNQILEGREIISQDPARRPREAEVLQVFRQVGLHAVRDLNAETSRSIQEAAEALYAQRGGDPVHIDRTMYREALTAVLGGNLPADMRRGRVTDYTILPPRVSEQQFRSWMERQTIATLTQFGTERQAPRWGDLRTPVPIQTIIDEGVFVMVSPGYYSIRMASDGRPLMTPNGNRYIMRVDARGLINTRPTPVTPSRYMGEGGAR